MIEALIKKNPELVAANTSALIRALRDSGVTKQMFTEAGKQLKEQARKNRRTSASLKTVLKF